MPVKISPDSVKNFSGFLLCTRSRIQDSRLRLLANFLISTKSRL